MYFLLGKLPDVLNIIRPIMTGATTGLLTLRKEKKSRKLLSISCVL